MYDSQLSILHGELSGLGKGPVFSYIVSSVYYTLYTVGIYIRGKIATKLCKKETSKTHKFLDCFLYNFINLFAGTKFILVYVKKL